MAGQSVLPEPVPGTSAAPATAVADSPAASPDRFSSHRGATPPVFSAPADSSVDDLHAGSETDEAGVPVPPELPDVGVPSNDRSVRGSLGCPVPEPIAPVDDPEYAEYRDYVEDCGGRTDGRHLLVVDLALTQVGNLLGHAPPTALYDRELAELASLEQEPEVEDVLAVFRDILAPAAIAQVRVWAANDPWSFQLSLEVVSGRTYVVSSSWFVQANTLVRVVLRARASRRRRHPHS